MFFQRQEKVDYEDDPGQQSEGNKSVAGPILVDVQHLARVKGVRFHDVQSRVGNDVDGEEDGEDDAGP